MRLAVRAGAEVAGDEDDGKVQLGEAAPGIGAGSS
jgi:hypothetical protein